LKIKKQERKLGDVSESKEETKDKRIEKSFQQRNFVWCENR
jgi:hypothetical protein